MAAAAQYRNAGERLYSLGNRWRFVGADDNGSYFATKAQAKKAAQKRATVEGREIGYGQVERVAYAGARTGETMRESTIAVARPGGQGSLRLNPRPRKVTDRAKRYRAQKAVRGKKVCAICGRKPARIDVMHLDGNESHGEQANLAYGCRSCNQKLAVAFKSIGAGRPTNQYNPAAGHVPTFEQYAWAVSSGARDYYPNSTRHARGVKDEAGAVIHATPKHKRVEYAKRIGRAAGQTKRAAFEDRWNPGLRSSRAIGYGVGRKLKGASAARLDQLADSWVRLSGYAGQSIAREREEYRAGLQDAVDEFNRARESFVVKRNPTWDGRPMSQAQRDAAYAQEERDEAAAAKHAEWVRAQQEKRLDQRNPAAASAEVFEEFHGHEPLEVVTVTKEVHTHGHLAAAGVLEKLVVMGIDRKIHSIEGFDGALLAFNERKNQLFIEGGDQSINLEDFGIRKPHERETLGKLRSIDYHTDKSHLGDEGGRATYTHEFRRTNKNGRHVKVKISRYPTLIYDVVNEALLISGGSYTIKAEGIDV